MFNLILLVVFAIGFAYFATFNVLTVPIFLGTFYSFPAVPLYAVVGITLLIGLLLSSLINLLGSIGHSLTLRSKNSEIKEGKETIHSMTKQTNDLQIENANLKGELKNDPTDELTL